MADPEADEPVEPAFFSRPLGAEELRAARRGLDLFAEATDTERAEIARQHDLIDLEALSYQARLEPFGRSGWRLSGRLRGRAAQRCVVTLEPVETEIDEPFLRLWSPDAPERSEAADAAGGRLDFMAGEPDLAEETGWTEADADGEDAPEIERTPEPIDPAAAALETFTLALDPYPRAPGASFEGATHGPPDAPPLTDEAARPFAGLETLRGKLEGGARKAGDSAESAPKDRPGGSRPRKRPPDAENA